MLVAVVAGETTFAATLIGRDVRFGSQRDRRSLIITAADCVAHVAFVVDVTDVRFVREERTVSAGHVFLRKFRRVQLLFGVANLAAGFLRRFLIAAVRQMADEAFGVRGDFQHSGFGRLRMAKTAIGLLSRRQVVGHVHLVLVGNGSVLFSKCAEESVEVIARREIALRRTRGQALFRVVADGAGLLRLGGELLNVAFNAGFVTGELQFQFFIAGGGRNQFLKQVALVVTGIAFQILRLIRAGNFDHAGVGFMRKLLVIRRRGRLHWRGWSRRGR